MGGRSDILNPVRVGAGRSGVEVVRERVATFAASESYYIDSSGLYKESDTRSEFIDVLLEALGWDVTNRSGVIPDLKDVVREESQEQEDAAVKFPDYTLRVAGSRRMFVEAKKPSVDVTAHMESIRQARRYGYTGGDPVVVLTNFRDLVVYDTTFGFGVNETPATGRVHRWHYTEFEAKFDEIRKVLGRPEVAAPDWSSQFTPTNRHRIPANEEFIKQFNDWRLALGRDLYGQDKTIAEADLNDAVQRILNRLIFVRMCEDRGIEGERTLREAAKGGTTTVAALLNRLHRRYNTGLFATNAAPLAAKVRDHVLQAIVNNLYAPQSPFSFAVLDATFLGLVYEATLAEHLTLVTPSGQPTRVELKKKREYEHREVVTTPQPLVDGTVRAALNALPIAATEPKSLDFAVGSGRFLLSLFDRLVENETQRLVAVNSPTLVKTGPHEYRLPFEEKRRVMADNLFGIDVDYNAVEVARFSLLVRLLQDESKHTLPPARNQSILPDLTRNIVQGNTLVRELPPGTRAEQLALTQPLDLATTALPPEFDLCLGNPPYMTPENMKKFDEVELEYLRDNYATAFQQFDKYFAFLEFSADRLKKGGVLGAVVPNKWMTIVAGREVRNLMRSTIGLVRLDNFREVQLFKDKSTYVCALIAQKGATGPFLYAEPADLSRYTAGYTSGYTIAPNTLPTSVTGAWVLPTDPAQAKVLAAVTADSVPLSDVVEPRNGIQTSAERNERYLVTDPTRTKGGLLRWVDKFGVSNEVEAALTRPFLKDSRALRSHHEVLPDRLIIFPYQPSATAPSGWEVIDPTVMKQSYPKAYAYFLSHKTELDRRSMSATERRKAFYAYGRTQAIPYAASAPKILYSTNQKGDKYALDLTGIVYASGGTAGEVALFPKGSKYDLDFILGLLDQPPVELFLRKRGSVFGGGWYARGTDVIAEAPVPRLDFTIAVDQQFHDDVVAKVRALRALNAKTRSVSQRNLPRHEAAIAAERATLQALFNQRWGLTAVEVEALGIR
jgi:hypothetical protein